MHEIKNFNPILNTINDFTYQYEKILLLVRPKYLMKYIVYGIGATQQQIVHRLYPLNFQFNKLIVFTDNIDSIDDIPADSLILLVNISPEFISNNIQLDNAIKIQPKCDMCFMDVRSTYKLSCDCDNRVCARCYENIHTKYDICSFCHQNIIESIQMKLSYHDIKEKKVWIQSMYISPKADIILYGNGLSKYEAIYFKDGILPEFAYKIKYGGYALKIYYS